MKVLYKGDTVLIDLSFSEHTVVMFSAMVGLDALVAKGRLTQAEMNEVSTAVRALLQASLNGEWGDELQSGDNDGHGEVLSPLGDCGGNSVPDNDK